MFRFAKRFGSILLFAVAIGSTAVAASYQSSGAAPSSQLRQAGSRTSRVRIPYSSLERAHTHVVGSSNRTNSLVVGRAYSPLSAQSQERPGQPSAANSGHEARGFTAIQSSVHGPVVREGSARRYVGAPSQAELLRVLSNHRHQAPQPVAGYAQIRLALGFPSSTNSGAPPANSGPRLLRPAESISARTAQQQGARHPNSPSNNLVTGPYIWTGINHWWTYEEDSLGGIGRYMINMASGNLVVQSEDMLIPNRGIELAFQRTYNSESPHTYSNTDGSGPSLYGDGWTNSFDARVAYNQTQTNGTCGLQQGISVFDIDGARYDYAPLGDCVTWIPPAGQFAQLYVDGSGYVNWLKPTGTRYVFESPTQLPAYSGRAGMVDQIIGRNANNSLTFYRTWSPDVTDAHNLWTLTITAEDLRSAVLQFGNYTDPNSHNFRLLASLTWPDGTTNVQYAYQFYPDLLSAYHPELYHVTEPSNGATGGPPIQQYLYAGPSDLQYADSPRWVANAGGPRYRFNYFSPNNVVNVWYYGDVNPDPNDGTATYLQPGVTHDLGATSSYRTVTITYPAATPNPGATATTTWKDSDGHISNYSWDSAGRVVQTSDLTGDPNPGPSNLIMNDSWDSNNNLVSSVDPRGTGHESDYQFDANGNLVAEAYPAVTFNNNQVRPTRLYSYDNFNNVVAYCDESETNLLGSDWTATPPPSDSLCPQSVGTSQFPTNTVLTWQPQSYEPYGELTYLYSPEGYQQKFSYPVGNSVDDGLPINVAGTCFSQSSGVQRCPAKQFSYDASGNAICYNDGSGWWVAQYDILGRTVSTDDPDDSLRSGCAAIPTASTHQARRQYFPGGLLQQSQTAAESASNAWSQFTYDLDGNPVTKLDHTNCPIGQSCAGNLTTSWYDGVDRVVEVSEPRDSGSFPDGTTHDFYSFPWMTRYLYDLSDGAGDSFSGTPVTAYGNLFDTQEYLGTTTSTGAWTDAKGGGYDALDRKIVSLSILPCTDQYVNNGVMGPLLCIPTVETAKSVYDADQSTYGLLASKTDPTNQTETYGYDNAGRVASIGFSPSSQLFTTGYPNNVTRTNTIYAPARTYTYDLNGRELGIASTFGTRSYSYDGDGNKQQEVEPGVGVTNAGTFGYGFYPDDSTASLVVTPSGGTQFTYNYAYQVDGRKNYESFQYGTNSPYKFSWTYSNAGRLLSIGAPVGLTGTTQSYDGYGRYLSESIYEGAYGNFGFDQEGEVAAYTYTATSQQPVTIGWAYSPRGELNYESNNNQSKPWTAEYQSSNGAMTRSTHSDWDARNSVWLGGPPYDQPGTVNFNWSESRAYGPIGQTGGDQNEITTYTDSFGDKCKWGSDSSYAKDYDAEHNEWAYIENSTTWDEIGHDPNKKCLGGPMTPTYAKYTVLYEWGELGHPTLVIPQAINSILTPDTLHWAENSLVYNSNSSGVEDIKIGTFADYSPSHVQMSMVGRNFAGYTPLTQDPFSPGIGISGSEGKNCYVDGACNSTWFAEPRPDEISDGLSAFQGVRAYDSGAVSWTTPDAYEGVVGDPLSQQSYMWNRNNPVTYADPTGFEPEPVDSQGNPLPPPIALPNLPDGTPNSWEPAPGTSGRNTKWKPRFSYPGQSQPQASWDESGKHYDVDNGKGGRVRVTPNGTYVDHAGNPIPAPQNFWAKVGVAAGAAAKGAAVAAGAAAVVYGLIKIGESIMCECPQPVMGPRR
jgi:YD repeat-containing protein